MFLLKLFQIKYCSACRKPESLFQQVLKETEYVIAGKCKLCGRLMVMTKEHGDNGELGYYPQSVYDMALEVGKGKAMRYNGQDLPNLHAPHEYLHIMEGL